MLAKSPPLNNENDILEAYAGLEGRELIRTISRDYKGRTALLSSFGAESSVLLHMVSEIDPNLPVVFLDTEKLFPETIAYRNRLVSDLGLKNIKIFHPSKEDLAEQDPDGNLHASVPDQCCNIRKTVPMERAFANYDVMISGRKRFHGAGRTNLKFVSIDGDRLKVEPLAGFTAFDLQSYMVNHQLPSHPLKLEGYRSIGCMPPQCTSPGGTDDNPREGRWMGNDKTECGIHFTANGKIIRSEIRSDP
jgi:phosphoadenosine phosphosulfate reductase